MDSYHNILDKLNRFTKKYYTKLLVKGLLLFVVLGLLFFVVIMSVEHFLWLGSSGRLVLLLVFLAVEGFLLYRYIAIPVFYLFKIRRGISNKEASLLIGKHFSEVGDKLYNLLDLSENKNQSELLLASIEQRSRALRPVPFTKAVDFRENIKYARYLIIPLLVFMLIAVSGNLASFFGSAGRVVNYDMAYEPPAPFQFRLLNETLDVLDTESYTIQLSTVGEVRPNAVFITIGDKEALLENQNGVFQYTLTPPLQTMEFYFEANGIKSSDYRLQVLKTPAIQDFEMKLTYPKYTNRSPEILQSTGNATLPEGTLVEWEVRGQNTERVKFIAKDTSLLFSNTDDRFMLTKRVYRDMEYEIATSNENVQDFEKLAYRFKVVRDAYPTIRAKQVLDSLNPNVAYYVGEATDDYRLETVQLVWYENGKESQKKEITLERPKANFNQFYYTFPSGLDLEAGKAYGFYFQATDNDAIHRGKTAKTQVFSLQLLNEDELKSKELQTQQSIIGNMDRSLEKFKEQKEVLKDINKGQKEKSQLSFNDQNQIKDFIKKQQQQEGMMQKFSKQLKENLQKTGEDDKLNKLLQERLERQEQQAKRNEELLEELNKVADKINKEELTKKLEDLGKKQQNSQRSLEQLLELTKRYYVTEKASQLSRDLEKLAERQHYLSEIKIGQDFSSKEQEKLNQDFQKIEAELKELKEDNQDLKKPLDLNIDPQKGESVKTDQKEALEQINKHEGTEESMATEERQKSAKTASQKQKSASEKMKEMAKDLQQSSSGGASGSSVAEDAEMLRQILDNLVIFSFKQENLFETLEDTDTDVPQFSAIVRKQQELRGLFEHVDDSLFALSLRQAELSEFVNEQITEVYYNIDKSLESLAENQIYQGVSYQKYVLNASNGLADFLAKLLDNMNQSMQMGQGSGQSQEGFQLPDIIQQQGGLKEKMEGMGESGGGKRQPQEGEGQGEQGEKGSKGDKGARKGEGKEGENGTDGKGENGEGDGKGAGGKNGSGKNGEQNGGQGEGLGNEEELKEIYEIYKEQQRIRQELEQQLQNMINNSDRKLGEKLLRQMEDFERDLLENGVTPRGLSKIDNIQYELLKLENAAMRQGKKKERESNTNDKRYQNPITTKPDLLKDYRDDVEILNRQALPLRPNFQKRVKDYFERND